MHIGRIEIIKADENFLNSVCVCPHCGATTLYGDMFMINGIHGCPACHAELSKTIEFDKKTHYEVYVRKANNHEYEPYRYRED